MPFLVLSLLMVFSSSAFSLTMKDLLAESMQSADTLVFEELSEVNNHRIVLSAAKRINNAMVIETEKRISGIESRAMIKFSSRQNMDQFSESIKNRLLKEGELAYQCEQRGCGVNTYWSNDLLQQRKLSGRDNDQLYTVGTLELDGAKYWLAIYLVTNSLRENIGYISLIKDESSQHWVNGLLISDSADFSKAVKESLHKKLKHNPQLSLYLVAYSNAVSPFSLQESQNQADKTLVKLVAQLQNTLGVPADKIKPIYVGPFHTQVAIVSTDFWYRLFVL